MEIPIAQTIPLKGIRGSLAKQFVQAYSTIPQVTLMSEIDMTELLKLRNSLLPEIEKGEGIRITHTHLLLKALAQALKGHPILNSNVVDDEIRIFTQVNIGLVVVTEEDIILAPVIHEVDKKSVVTVAKRASELAERVRKGTFSKEDFYGGTFTLSNIGMFGAQGSVTPLIVLPQSAILLVGTVEKKPVVRNEEIVIRSMMSCSLTFDHRVMTAVPPTRFLHTLADILENPHKIELGI